MQWQSGLEFTLDALSLLKKRGFLFQYTIVGDGPYLEAVAFACHQHGLEDVVNLVRKASIKQRKKMMEKADLLILNSLNLVDMDYFNEMITSGKPLIASNTFQRNLKVQGKNDIIFVSTRDSNALADAITRFTLKLPPDLFPDSKV